MPTGYTADLVEKGQTFREFALTCARAFGACIMQRDDPLNQPPQRQEPSDYHIKEIAKAKSLLSELSAMDAEQRFAYGEALRNEAVAAAESYQQKELEQDKRLAEMTAHVNAWTPPTADHVGLKDFMLDQIKISRKGNWYAKYVKEAVEKAPADYFAEALDNAKRDIEYHTKEHAEEVSRNDERNEWIEKLYSSLPE